MRRAASDRDAAILSVLAYAGLRPGELRLLRWRDVRERTLLLRAEKTGSRRAVRLLAALAEDLRAWRTASREPPVEALIFADEQGQEWTANGFEKWRQRRYGRLLSAAGLDRGRPYDLRHSFASLLLHEGRDVIYVAGQLGHGAELTLRTYGTSSRSSRTRRSPCRGGDSASTGAPVQGRRVPVSTSASAGGGAGGPGSPVPTECPEQDSNLRPTP